MPRGEISSTDTTDFFSPPPIEVGSYVLIQGIVRHRASVAGVSMLAHTVKDLTDEVRIRSRLWHQELEEYESFNQEKLLELEERESSMIENK